MLARRGVWWAALALLGAFLIASYHLERESLWYDEGWSLWAVRDEQKPPASVGQTIQFVRTSISSVLARVRGDVHPPLYFLSLDIWTLLTGESVFSVRLLSALFGMIGLAGTYAVGRQLFDRPTGLMALIVTATASFFVYYTREARMYTLLLATAALSTWAYLGWLRQPSFRRTLIYALAMAALIYTHYAGALVIAAQVIHLVSVSIRRRSNATLVIRCVVPFFLALILYFPWIPALIDQVRVNNGRPLAQALPTDWGTVAALFLIMTSGNWGQYVLPFLLGRALPEVRRHASAISLLVLWLLVTPAALLALNAWVSPVFQIRYTIAMLPAGALVIAYGLRYVGIFNSEPQRHSGIAKLFLRPASLVRGHRESQLAHSALIPHPSSLITRYSSLSPLPNKVRAPSVLFLQSLLRAFLLLWLAYTQLAMYAQFWPDKPRWNATVAGMVAARQPLDPAIVDFLPQSVVAYYDRQLHLRRGISVDVSWRDHTPEEMRSLVNLLDKAPSVWVVLRTDMPADWDALALLAGTRRIGYRDSVINTIFYRFDQPPDQKCEGKATPCPYSTTNANAGALRLRFGDLLRYDGGIGHQLYARAGERYCLPVTLQLTTLKPLEDGSSAGVYLTEGYNTLRARWDTPLGAHGAGETFILSPCLDLPVDLMPNNDHLRLIVYQGNDLNRQPVIEGGDASNLYWGTEIIFAEVRLDH